MDILFLIKSELHKLEEQICGVKAAVLAAKPASQAFSEYLEQLRVYAALDRELIYPELSELFANSPKLLEQSNEQREALMQNSADLKRGFDEFEGSSGETEAALAVKTNICTNLESVLANIQGHLVFQQEHILPRLRELIPTQEREDFGQLYLEMKDEMTKHTSSSFDCQEQVG